MIIAIIVFMWLLFGYAGFALITAYFVRAYKEFQNSQYINSNWFGYLSLSLFGIINFIAVIVCLIDFANDDGYTNPFKYGMKFTRKYEPY